MEFSMKTKLKDVIKDPDGKALLEEYFPMDLEAPTTRIAYGMTLEKCFSFPQVEVPKEKIDEFMERLVALNDR